ncbi:MAG TPA: flagella basal body P-ring formation protein FlgA, partial [bacterium]|nr:flagella basal body P-ring formation protein FlgA [bacterium]
MNLPPSTHRRPRALRPWCAAGPGLALLGLALLAMPMLAMPRGAWAAPQSAAGDLDTVTVRVMPRSEVQGDTYTLGDIAEFDGFDVQRQTELAKIELGRSPLPGYSLPLNAPQIRSRLAGQAGTAHLQLIVPEHAQLLRAAQNVPSSQVEDLVLKQAGKDSGGGANLKQEIVTRVPALQLPVGDLQWSIAPLGQYLLAGGDRNYQVIARVNGVEAWRGMVRVHQKLYQNVVVAAHPLQRAQLIAAGDVTVVQRVLSGTAEAGYLADPAKAIGKRTRRPVAQDEALQEGILDAPAAVTQGGRVTVLYQ